jgi:hypothetical protein
MAVSRAEQAEQATAGAAAAALVHAAVFDNLHALGRVDRHFEFAAKKNMLVGHKPDEEDSQFEVRGQN